jgi:IgGFc binding protein
MKPILPILAFATLTVWGCAATEDVVATGRPDAGAGSGATGGSSASGGDSGTGGGINTDGGQSDSGGVQCAPCSDDFSQVLNCDRSVKETCPPEQLCGAGTCMAPCEAAKVNKSTVGCDYYAVTMDAMGGGFGGCFVSFIANTSKNPVQIQASWGGQSIDLGVHAAIPKGTGTNISYTPYNPSAGLPPGEVAILFLANDPVQHGSWLAPAACPVPAAVGLDAHVHDGVSIYSGHSKGFHITTDNPVVAYQMLPFNAAYAATTGATLLLPTTAWDTNYVAVAASSAAIWQGLPIPPSTSIVAAEDGTVVQILAKTEIKQGFSIPTVPANTVGTFKMNAGETIEFVQAEELTGSPIVSNKPIGMFAGHLGLRVPQDVDWSDHAEQQVPPIRALGNEYAVVSYRDRVPGYPENRHHRIVGAVDGTTLEYDPPIPGTPTKLDLGTIAEFDSDTPFVVKSQDGDHPFMVFTYMSGSSNIANAGGPAGYGDPDFLRVVPGPQYLKRYVFFTDPTYPETNLVVVRKKDKNGFSDVTLDCYGKLDGFSPVGSDGNYEYTRVDLSRHDFEAQGNCDNGRHEMYSDGHFGLFVWGWGSPETRPNASQPCDNTQPDNSCDVSYAYAAGENVTPINTVYIPAVPK